MTIARGLGRGRERGSIGKCKAIGQLTDDTLVIACAIRKRVETTGLEGGDAIIAFVERGEVYATRISSNTAQVLGSTQIIGTYTRRTKALAIADDVQAWKEAA